MPWLSATARRHNITEESQSLSSRLHLELSTRYRESSCRPLGSQTGKGGPLANAWSHRRTQCSIEDTSDGFECCFCRENTSQSQAVQLSRCRHSELCTSWIELWLEERTNCPMCRAEVLSATNGLWQGNLYDRPWRTASPCISEFFGHVVNVLDLLLNNDSDNAGVDPAT
jgi:hypothetical protein